MSGNSRSDKTFIGRIEKGFDFLGYHFGTDGLSVARKTIEQFIARAIRLYEQEPEEACASARLGLYVRRWVRWAAAGLGGDAGTSLVVDSTQYRHESGSIERPSETTPFTRTTCHMSEYRN